MADNILKAWNWSKLDPKERQYWSAPSKDVFQFAFYLKELRYKRVYDLGCGIGRNMFFLSDMGFEVYGSDYSLDAVNVVNQKLEEFKFPYKVKHESMTEISEKDENYDAVIAYNVIYHAYTSNMKKALNHIYRILKPEGSLLITFQSKRSPVYKPGEEVEPGTIIKKDGFEAGIPHHFVDRAEIFNLLTGYQIIELSHVEHEYDDLRFKGCHFVVTAKKSLDVDIRC
jgi:SAM-dependent methyltransferase